MVDKVTYLSDEWRSEAQKRLQENLSPEKMNHLSASMSNIYKNCPDGRQHFLYMRYEQGRLAEFLTGTGEVPPAEFAITGDYEIFARISKSELASHKALMTGKLKLKGNMVKALKLASLADRINKVFATIPADY